ncbi:hypothetical protein [Spirillospora albida]|uniref:hypothetical protein n=1 Tax=Spirillospora albida TaxID=58123 RepID=UPI0012FB6B96|nr:hypothetical protein [Spirillospora albida]
MRRAGGRPAPPALAVTWVVGVAHDVLLPVDELFFAQKQAAEGCKAMDERRAIKVLLRP